MKEYTVKQVSEETGESRRTLIKRANARKAGKKRGKLWRFTAEEVRVISGPGVRGNPRLLKKALSKWADGSF